MPLWSLIGRFEKITQHPTDKAELAVTIRIPNLICHVIFDMCATRPKYIDQLSPASVHSLNLQGGPMSNDEVKVFEKNPNLKQIIQVRLLDDSGKREGGETYPFSHFIPLLQRLVDLSLIHI